MLFLFDCDGVLVDSFLGEGDGLDDYSHMLRTEDTRSNRVRNDLKAVEVETYKLANKIIEDGDEKRAAIFKSIYPMMTGMQQRITELGLSLQGRDPQDEGKG